MRPEIRFLEQRVAGQEIDKRCQRNRPERIFGGIPENNPGQRHDEGNAIAFGDIFFAPLYGQSGDSEAEQCRETDIPGSGACSLAPLRGEGHPSGNAPDDPGKDMRLRLAFEDRPEIRRKFDRG